MAFPTVTVYGNSDSCSQLRLLNNNIPVNLAPVIKMVLELDDNTEISSVDNPKMFNWEDCNEGVLTLKLGYKKWWPDSIFYAKLIVYDAGHIHGIYWGTLRIRALENTVVEGVA